MIKTTGQPEMTQGQYVKVNGVNLYYEIHGQGQPLILLHGGLGSIDMFRPILPALAKNRQVVGVDLQGNGHTADIDRPFSFQQMADDMAALVKQLGLVKADLMGYSLGGAVALQTAIRRPEVVHKLVLVSTAYKSDNWYPESRAGMRALNAEAAKAMVGSPPHRAYVSAAPDPDNWPTLVTKTGLLVGQEYDWSKDVEKMTTPTLLVFGDADAIAATQIAQFYKLLGGGKQDAGWDGSGMPTAKLAILPGTTHYDIFMSPLLPCVVTAFLDAPMPGTSRT